MIIRFIKYLLLPVSFLYGVIMDIRNLFYDIGVFKSYKFDIPVISVGNITAGGTGKTPFVIWLVKKLEQKYRKIVVISRGYGRNSRGMLEVNDYKHPQRFGDEPTLITMRVPQAVVIVSENRKKAIEYAIEKKNADLIILDDAFQHRSIRRDADIVLINANEKLKNNFPLPGGSLREFKHNLNRGDIFILTNYDDRSFDNTILPPNRFFKSKGRLKNVINHSFDSIGNINDFASKPIVAFSAIAHPLNFKRYLQKYGIKIEAYFSFRDHYAYNADDISKIIKTAEEKECDMIFCTEKDLVKICAVNILPEEAISRFYAVQFEPEIREEEKLLKKISDHIDKNTK